MDNTYKKKCTKCDKLKDSTEFYKDKRTSDGLYSDCKQCHCKYNKTTEGKARRREYIRKYHKTPRNSIKYKCRKKTTSAMQRGKIQKRNSCEICHASPTECHHEDYTKPFEFIELCKQCHVVLHRQYRTQGITIN